MKDRQEGTVQYRITQVFVVLSLIAVTPALVHAFHLAAGFFVRLHVVILWIFLMFGSVNVCLQVRSRQVTQRTATGMLLMLGFVTMAIGDVIGRVSAFQR